MINFAATFDNDLMREVAENIGKETRILGKNMLLAPMCNIARTPFGGRSFELFGEDPYLVSSMTVEYVKGLQSQNVIACPKIMVANNQEMNRSNMSVRIDERTLREIYLPAFKAAVQEADAWSIMAGYNKVNGDYVCESKTLLNDIVKNEWGFTGFTISEWGGVRSTIKTANSGLDLEMPEGTFYGENLLKVIQKGEVQESTLDDKVRRILRVMFKAGLFDESFDSYGGKSDTPERRALALDVAEKSIVLLKNENNYLPLDKSKISSIAVIGQNGNIARMTGGGSGLLRGNYGISPLQGIRDKVGEEISVEYERGFPEKKLNLTIASVDHFLQPDGKPGLYAEYFNNKNLEGEPVYTCIEKDINFNWGYGNEDDPSMQGSPKPGVVNLDEWSARWTSKFKPLDTSWYEIGLRADNGVRLYLDGEKIIDAWVGSNSEKYNTFRYKFEKDHVYDLRVEFYENLGSCLCKLGLDLYDTQTTLESAVSLAERSDVVILVLGLGEEFEGEGNDRSELELPEDQRELLKSILLLDKNCIVVLNNGTPILMNKWIDDVSAVVEAFYPGQEGGNALANILFGDVNPSGKLPITIPKRLEDTPVYNTYPGTEELTEYKEGIFVGYRHFDKYNIEPHFPFGYGLSYTTFEYSNLIISQNKISLNDTVSVQVTIRNTGKMAGDEIVQLYIKDEKSSVEREVKSLKGFSRVSLQPGESKVVSFQINKSHLSFYDIINKKWKAEPGLFKLQICASSRDIKQEAEILLN